MGVVYKKICSETGQVYYGKFEGTWKQRYQRGWETCSCKNFVNPTHEFIEIDIPNDKLKEREDYYINNNECVNLMGKYIHLTRAEYDKQHYINNKDIIIKKNKQYYIDNKDTIIKKKKQYYIDNPEYHKQYRIDNKETINQKNKCNNCGSTINKQNLKRHHATNKCMNFTESHLILASNEDYKPLTLLLPNEVPF
tara:strand:- start:186 stop:770 length:585 start_codon:yes stop_codon:yes gene_type:complete